MSLKEYQLIGGGKYSYMEKVKSAKRLASAVPLDTTFNEISGSPDTKSPGSKTPTRKIEEIKARSKSSDAFVKVPASPKQVTIIGHFKIGGKGSSTDGRNRTTLRSTGRDKITNNEGALQNMTKLLNAT
jgi:hypothetical protein